MPRAPGCGRPVRRLPRRIVRDRLQHQSGEEGGGAQSYADLLDPKWAGKMVKAHPGYSGTIMTATFQLTQALGWEYLEKLAKQRAMQVAVRRRSAQEARTRRTCDPGRRQRIQPVPDEGGRQAGRNCLCDRGRAGGRRAERNLPRMRPTRTPRACSSATASRPSASSSWSTRRRPALDASARQGEARAQTVWARSRPSRRTPGPSRRWAKRSRRATASCSGCELFSSPHSPRRRA